MAFAWRYDVLHYSGTKEYSTECLVYLFNTQQSRKMNTFSGSMYDSLILQWSMTMRQLGNPEKYTDFFC